MGILGPGWSGQGKGRGTAGAYRQAPGHGARARAGVVRQAPGHGRAGAARQAPGHGARANCLAQNCSKMPNNSPYRNLACSRRTVKIKQKNSTLSCGYSRSTIKKILCSLVCTLHRPTLVDTDGQTKRQKSGKHITYFYKKQRGEAIKSFTV